MLELIKDRLKSFGYEPKEGDDFAILFAMKKAENTIKNDCNTSDVPDGLIPIAVDMAVGEFLTAKKTFDPKSIEGLNLDYAVKQIKTGDTDVSFAIGAGSSTPEQRLDTFLNYLLTYGRGEFSCYRKIKW